MRDIVKVNGTENRIDKVCSNLSFWISIILSLHLTEWLNDCLSINLFLYDCIVYLTTYLHTCLSVWVNYVYWSCYVKKKSQIHNVSIIILDFSIHRGKMEQILPAYGISKETVAAIMILYRNTKVKVRSLDGDTDYFDIVAGVLQGHTLTPNLFIISLDYVLRTSIDKIKENGFELTKKRSRRYPAKTITDVNYADDISILANAPTQAETLLHSLKRAAVGLHVNAHKMEYMCFNQTGDISTLGGSSLKLLNKFTYLGSSVSSTDKDIDTRLAKA